VRRDLVEAQLLVVVRAHPFGGVDGALFQCGVDVAARDVLGHGAQARHHLAADAGDAHLQALEVGRLLDFLLEPAAHLHPGVAAGEADDVEVLHEVTHQLLAAAVVQPGVLLPLVEAEGQGGLEAEGLVLADEVVAGRVAAFDAAPLQCIDHTKSGHQFAGRVHRNLELAAGDGRHALGQHLGAAVDRVQALGEAGSEPPADVR
jgi:hypothetical protein